MSTNSQVYMKSYYRKNRKEIIAALGGQCLICAAKKDLEIHHVSGCNLPENQGRGMMTRLTDWKRNMNNLALLCHDHHVEYHSRYEDTINHDTLLDYILFKFIENTEWRYI